MKRKGTAILCALLSVCILLGAADQGLPVDESGVLRHTKSFYINDYADVLSGEEEALLLEAAGKLQAAARGTQLVLVTLPAPPSGDRQAYAEQLLTVWGVGSSAELNGVVVVVTLDPVTVTLAAGRGLQPVVGAFVQTGFIDNAVLPVFTQGEAETGVWLLYQTLYEQLCAAYDLDPATVSGGSLSGAPPLEVHSHAVFWVGIVCICLFSVLVGILLYRKKDTD